MIIKYDRDFKFNYKDSNKLIISNEIKEKVDNYFKEFIKDRDGYWDGDIFIVTNLDLNNGIIEIGKTKYSSLVYAKKNKDLEIKPLFATILLSTLDNKYLIIKNNHNSINLIGGMADKEDFINNEFCPDLCIRREVLEEIGIDLNDTNQVLYYDMKYLKIPTNNENYYTIGVLYTGKLNYTSDEFRKYVKCNKFDGEIKEYYFFTKEECLKLELTEQDVSYLKELVLME